MSNWHKIGALLITGGLLWACQDEQFEGPADGPGKVIALSGEIEQQNVSRVDDGGFCDGDVMGVYIVDYVNGDPGELLDAGNRATNVKFTFDEAAYRWNGAYDVYWKDDKKSLRRAVAHMNVGTKAVMSPFFAYYLEYPYGMTSLKKCFSRDPVPKGAGEKSIKGVECAIWTEYIADTKRMDEMLYPRLAAVAERGWSRWHADYRSFKTRLGAAYNIFDKYGVGYATMVEVDPGPVRKIASLLKFGKNFLHPSMKESLKRQKLNRKRLKEKYPDGKQ